MPMLLLEFYIAAAGGQNENDGDVFLNEAKLCAMVVFDRDVNFRGVV